MSQEVRFIIKNDSKYYEIKAHVDQVKVKNIKSGNSSFEVFSDFFRVNTEFTSNVFFDETELKLDCPKQEAVVAPVQRSEVAYKDSIFNRINNYIKNRNFAVAYEEISKLRFIRIQLATHILNSGNRNFIEKINKNPNFNNLPEFFAPIISSSKSCIPIPFDIWKRELELSFWVQLFKKSLESHFPYYMESILGLNLKIDYTENIVFLANTGNIEYLEKILSLTDKYTINFEDYAELYACSNNDKIIQIYCLLYSKSKKDCETKTAFLQAIEKIIGSNYNPLNIDTVYMYCNITSFNPKNFEKPILNKLLLNKNSQTIWFEKNNNVRFSPYTVEFCLKSLKEFLEIGNKKNDKFVELELENSDDEYEIGFLKKSINFNSTK
ncbi:hypothetical protein [Carp edema virus]|nr:hypothetical protein [Carp edema virus]